MTTIELPSAKATVAMAHVFQSALLQLADHATRDGHPPNGRIIDDCRSPRGRMFSRAAALCIVHLTNFLEEMLLNRKLDIRMRQTGSMRHVLQTAVMGYGEDMPGFFPEDIDLERMIVIDVVRRINERAERLFPRGFGGVPSELRGKSGSDDATLAETSEMMFSLLAAFGFDLAEQKDDRVWACCGIPVEVRRIPGCRCRGLILPFWHDETFIATMGLGLMEVPLVALLDTPSRAIN